MDSSKTQPTPADASKKPSDKDETGQPRIEKKPEDDGPSVPNPNAEGNARRRGRSQCLADMVSIEAADALDRRLTARCNRHGLLPALILGEGQELSRRKVSYDLIAKARGILPIAFFCAASSGPLNAHAA